MSAGGAAYLSRLQQAREARWDSAGGRQASGSVRTNIDATLDFVNKELGPRSGVGEGGAPASRAAPRDNTALHESTLASTQRQVEYSRRVADLSRKMIQESLQWVNNPIATLDGSMQSSQASSTSAVGAGAAQPHAAAGGYSSIMSPVVDRRRGQYGVRDGGSHGAASHPDSPEAHPDVSPIRPGSARESVSAVSPLSHATDDAPASLDASEVYPRASAVAGARAPLLQQQQQQQQQQGVAFRLHDPLTAAVLGTGGTTAYPSAGASYAHTSAAGAPPSSHPPAQHFTSPPTEFRMYDEDDGGSAVRSQPQQYPSTASAAAGGGGGGAAGLGVSSASMTDAVRRTLACESGGAGGGGRVNIHASGANANANATNTSSTNIAAALARTEALQRRIQERAAEIQRSRERVVAGGGQAASGTPQSAQHPAAGGCVPPSHHQHAAAGTARRLFPDEPSGAGGATTAATPTTRVEAHALTHPPTSVGVSYQQQQPRSVLPPPPHQQPHSGHSLGNGQPPASTTRGYAGGSAGDATPYTGGQLSSTSKYRMTDTGPGGRGGGGGVVDAAPAEEEDVARHRGEAWAADGRQPLPTRERGGGGGVTFLGGGGDARGGERQYNPESTSAGGEEDSGIAGAGHPRDDMDDDGGDAPPSPAIEEAVVMLGEPTSSTSPQRRGVSPISINTNDLALRQARQSDARRWDRLKEHVADADAAATTNAAPPHLDDVRRLLDLRAEYEEEETQIQMCEVGLLLERRIFSEKLRKIRAFAVARSRELKRSRAPDYDEGILLDAICSVVQPTKP